MGLIAGAMSGLGEAGVNAARQLGEHYSRSKLQEEAATIQAQRDKTLADLQRERDDREGARRRGDIDYELAAKAKPYSEAQSAADARIAAESQPLTPNDDEGNPMPRSEFTPQARRKVEAQEYRRKGLIGEAMRMEDKDTDTALRTREIEETAASRRAAAERDERQHSERMKQLDAQIANQRAQIGLEERKVGILEASNLLEKEDKKIIRDARDRYITETDPEKKAELGAAYMTLLGKAGERWEAIKEKDPVTGDVVTTGYLDRLTGRRIGPEGRSAGGAPKPKGERPPLSAFFK